jgi:hypothetical protein
MQVIWTIGSIASMLTVIDLVTFEWILERRQRRKDKE